MVRAGLKAGHRVANLFYAGHLYGGFLYIEASLHNAPVENVRLPVGGHVPDEEVAELIASFGVNVLAGTPMKLAGVAEAVLDAGSDADSVELLMFAGDLLFDDVRPLLHKAFPLADDRLARLRERGRRDRRRARARRRRPRARGRARPHDRGDPGRGDRGADHRAGRARPGRGHQPVPHADADHPVPRRATSPSGSTTSAGPSGSSAAPTRAPASPTSRWRTSTCTPRCSAPTATE